MQRESPEIIWSVDRSAVFGTKWTVSVEASSRTERAKSHGPNPKLIMIYAASILLAFAIKYMPKQNL
jgi:hypothetical protein